MSDFPTDLMVIRLLNKKETIRQLKESEEDIKLGRVKTIRSVKDLLSD